MQHDRERPAARRPKLDDVALGEVRLEAGDAVIGADEYAFSAMRATGESRGNCHPQQYAAPSTPLYSQTRMIPSG